MSFEINWIAAGAIAEWVGVIGVIASLWYLAKQLKENSKEIRRAASQNLLSNRNALNTFLASDGEGARIFFNCIDNPDVASKDDQNRFLIIGATMIRHFESIYLDRNQLSESLWESQENSIRRWTDKPGLQWILTTLDGDFSQEFIKEYRNSSE